MTAAQSLKKYRWDLLLITASSVAAVVLAVSEHGKVKWYTSDVAMIAPLVFAGALLLTLTLVGMAGRARWLGEALRVLLVAALVALIAPTAFLEVEKAVAPYEWLRGTDVPTVIKWIAADDNSERIHAWARILTLSKTDKEAVARGLAPLILGNDESARHSAGLTLEVSLRKHCLATLAAMRGELRSYLAAKAAGSTATESAQRAGQFSKSFVQNNLVAVRKALSKSKRQYLPEGGLEALFLSLATDDQLGPLYLRELAIHGDNTEKALAQSVMQLAAISIPAA